VSFFSSIGAKLKEVTSAFLDAAARFFGSLFQAEVDIVDNLQHIVEKFDETKAAIEHEVQLLHDFQFNPHWKSRVINVPIAVDQMKTLIATVVNAFKGKFELFKAPIHDLALIFKAESQPASDQDKPSALARTAVKIDEIATMIKQLAKAMDEVANIAHVFETVTEQLQSLDSLFLSQGRPQKKQTLTIRKRQ
jgi:methyl-accepting chemotaxis protein